MHDGASAATARPIVMGVAGAEDTVATLHAAVPGRARFKVPAIYRDGAACRAITQGLCGSAGIRHVSANALTGTLLVLFDCACPLDAVVTRVTQQSHAIAVPVRAPAKGERVIRPDFSAAGGRRRHAGPPRVTHRQPQPVHPWHTMGAREVLLAVGSSRQRGLSDAAAQRRRAANGPNALPPPPRRTRLEMLLSQFCSLPVALLGASALASVLTGGIADAVVIAGVVLLNAAFGYATESQTEREIASLSEGASHQALVLRNSVLRQVDARELVAGDILVLSPGAYVAADARLIEGRQLCTDESVLTGESMPMQKHQGRLDNAGAPLAERSCMLYMGSTVVAGTGLAAVVATGAATEMGIIQTLVGSTRPPMTPMQRQLQRFGNQTVRLASALCGLVFALGLLRGQGLLTMFRSSVSLAVAAVPEGLPTVATTTLALGIRRMRRQRVLVRRLDAVETLGAVHTVCFDKTGTLTDNHMRVMAMHASMERSSVVDGALYSRHGRINPFEHDVVLRLLHVAVLCNDVELRGTFDNCGLTGSSTELALVELALSAGVDVEALRSRHPRIDVAYRTETRTYMSTLHGRSEADASQVRLLAVKGNPAEVLDLCVAQEVGGTRLPLSEADRKAILAVNDEMGGEALRMLGFAYAIGDATQTVAPHDLCWLGMLGLADPIRSGARDLIALLGQAGVRTVMITGDQSVTAGAVAQALGIRGNGGPAIVQAHHIAELEDSAFAEIARHTNVFARVSAPNKLKIVRGLQSGHDVVAMVGDGVNDGPALKASDISVAMGRHSTDLAREVADVVLEDDNLQTLTVAISQGRTIYNNIRKSVHFLVSTNLSEIITTLAAVGLHVGQPLTPMQLLWINLLSDVLPALALAVEPPEPDVLLVPPRDPGEPIVRREDRKSYGMQALGLSASALAAQAIASARHGGGAAAGTVSFMTLTLGQLLHAYRCRADADGTLSVLRRPRNPQLDLAIAGTVALQGLAAIVPGLRRLLDMSPIDAVDALTIALGASGGYLFNEATGRRRKPARAS